jgi:hypothetical protein
MEKQGYRKSTVRYCIQALKSVARNANLLEPESVKTYLARAELSESRKAKRVEDAVRFYGYKHIGIVQTATNTVLTRFRGSALAIIGVVFTLGFYATISTHSRYSFVDVNFGMRLLGSCHPFLVPCRCFERMFICVGVYHTHSEVHHCAINRTIKY